MLLCGYMLTEGTVPGGVHFELTGKDVTECAPAVVPRGRSGAKSTSVTEFATTQPVIRFERPVRLLRLKRRIPRPPQERFGESDSGSSQHARCGVGS